MLWMVILIFINIIYKFFRGWHCLNFHDVLSIEKHTYQHTINYLRIIYFTNTSTCRFHQRCIYSILGSILINGTRNEITFFHPRRRKKHNTTQKFIPKKKKKCDYLIPCSWHHVHGCKLYVFSHVFDTTTNRLS